jgi:hypothetical protein
MYSSLSFDLLFFFFSPLFLNPKLLPCYFVTTMRIRYNVDIEFLLDIQLITNISLALINGVRVLDY